MDIETLFTMLGNYAFPVVACIIMFRYVKETTSANREDIRLYSQEISSLKEEIKNAMSENTIAINRLCDRLEKGDKNSET